MKQFNFIFKKFLQYYIYWLSALVIIAFLIPKPFIIGLIIGSFGSLINTYIFELYLSKAQKEETSQISTGGIWRFLVALAACCIWLFFKNQVNIFGVMIGLMISYFLIIFRPFLHKM
ncbi:ATP synthase subunit I [Staphylococcus sp. IVB6181]|uniref:ATP synthase subunit I n=1 Tax=Staphylococcus TaxID=1279 RepID=UPI000D03275A|nr:MULTISPECIES: ATP synthase subunit I [Staphylococcus]MCD8916186.1 ATP synthase subunit I [Staphylococcus simulans]UXV35783.1 ATP synthase subunit I [Staphylococcus sp. IVB6181]